MTDGAHVRQDLDEHDARRAGAERARGLHVLALADRERLGPHDPPHRRPAEERDHGDADREARAHHATSARAKTRNGSDRNTSIVAREDAVDDAAVPAGDDADDRADQHGERAGEKADEQRHPRAVGDADQHVAAETVGAEQERAARGQRNPGR